MADHPKRSSTSSSSSLRNSTSSAATSEPDNDVPPLIVKPPESAVKAEDHAKAEVAARIAKNKEEAMKRKAERERRKQEEEQRRYEEEERKLAAQRTTAQASLAQYGIKGTDHVGVIGIGGLGHLAIQFASKMGCHVTVFSGTDSKKQEAEKLGAKDFVAMKGKKVGEVKLGKRLNALLVTTSVQPGKFLILLLLGHA